VDIPFSMMGISKGKRMNFLRKIFRWIGKILLSVPVQIKIIGIGLIPVVILGLALDYWVTSGLSNWLSHLIIDEQIRAAMEAGRRSVLIVTVLAAGFSIVISLLLSTIISHPILTLREMARKVVSGQLDARARVWAHDEIGQLAVAINTMTDHLVTTQRDLVRTNRRLRAINQIAQATDDRKDIHDVLFTLLGKILPAVRLKTGWIYLMDPELHQFHLATWVGVPKEMGEILIHQQDTSPCTCQSYLMSGNQDTEIAIRPCDCLTSFGYPKATTSHITIPLEARGQKLGVINLLCDKDASLMDDDMDLLASIGAQISEIVANAWLRLKLREKELARQALLESLVKAQEEERRRLACELHDCAGQALTTLLVRLKTLEKKKPSSELVHTLQGMEGIVSQTIETIRSLSYRLRPAALEEFGLSIALETLVRETVQGTGLKVICKCGLRNHHLPEEIEVTLYRIAQEALTNILRHASAKEIKLVFKPVPGGVQLCLEDDGIGFNPAHLPGKPGQRHLGLVSMRERAEMLGGTLDVYTAPDKGTSVQVFLPLKDALNI
jgi:signal transduction histidine kinase